MTVALITKNTTQQNGATADNIYTGVVDTHLRMNTATTNYGTLADLNVFKFDATNHYHALIRFDSLSSIPSNATVSSASLFYRVKAEVPAHAHDLSLRRMLQAWTVAGATWNTYDGTTAWNTAGALGAGTDRVSTAESVTSSSTGTNYKELDCTSLVQDIVDGTIVSDEGFHIERTDAGNDGNYKTYHSSDGTDGSRPELVVTYTVPVGAAITSVGGDDIVLDAEQNVSFVTSGFSGEISAVQLVSGTSITTINPASINSTGGSGDFDLIDISALTSPTVGAPLTTANNIVVARLTDA